MEGGEGATGEHPRVEVGVCVCVGGGEWRGYLLDHHGVQVTSVCCIYPPPPPRHMPQVPRGCGRGHARGSRGAHAHGPGPQLAARGAYTVAAS